MKANKWNFHGIAKNTSEGDTDKVQKMNILLWPDRIKKLVTASALMPGRQILKESYYLKKEEWLKEAGKIRRLHGDKENKLWNKIWERDKGKCGICNQTLVEEITDFKSGIELHYVIPLAEGGENKMGNMVLTHQICHKAWHVERGLMEEKIKRKLTKNRGEIK